MQLKKENAKWFTLGILSMLFLSIAVLAFEEGEIIPRNTFRNTDFGNQNLDCQQEGGAELTLDLKQILIHISCLNAEIIDDSDMLVVRNTDTYRIDIFGTHDEDEMQSLTQCLGEGNTPRGCWQNEFKPKIISQVSSKRGKIRLGLNYRRDGVIPESLNLNDLTLTNKDLND